MTKKTKTKTPFILTILDGWGIYKDYNGNAITQAKTPTFDMLWKNKPHTELCASGECVGLSASQDGNSEAGHMNLGAGRIVDQDTIIISKAIEDGSFFKNPAFNAVVEHAKRYKSDVHLMGLLTGWQSAHADLNHVFALLKFLRQHKIKNVYLHLFTDGRDSFKYGAFGFLKKLESHMESNEKIASITGRYYAMDRKKKWKRTEQTYNMLTWGQAEHYAQSASQAIQSAYDRGETDEFISPTVIVEHGKCDQEGVCISGQPAARIKDNDAVIYFNLRSDRARQLTKPFVQKDFNKKNPGSFKRRKVLKKLTFVAMTDFGPDLGEVLSAFPSADLKTTLPMVLADKKQLYISENEKYAHVTYFFNGGYADPVGGEDRIMIPSPDIATYDLKPEMSSYEVTDKILEVLGKDKYDFITVNFANPDMVGHTGNLAAGIKACQAVDKCLTKIYKKIKDKQGVMIIISDHGNIEEMISTETGEVDTQHSSYPVPFIVCDERQKNGTDYKLRTGGVLGSVAPTILDLMGVKQPKDMTEKSLIIK